MLIFLVIVGGLIAIALLWSYIKSDDKAAKLKEEEHQKNMSQRYRIVTSLNKKKWKIQHYTFDTTATSTKNGVSGMWLWQTIFVTNDIQAATDKFIEVVAKQRFVDEIEARDALGKYKTEDEIKEEELIVIDTSTLQEEIDKKLEKIKNPAGLAEQPKDEQPKKRTKKVKEFSGYTGETAKKPRKRKNEEKA